MKNVSLILFGLLMVNLTFAQDVNQPSVYDMNNVYKKNHHIEKDVIKQPHLREADVMWSNKNLENARLTSKDKSSFLLSSR